MTSNWYVLQLYVDLEKFLTRYHAIPTKTRLLVTEMVTFRRPDKALYQHELGIFVGYVFVQMTASNAPFMDDALRGAGIAEVLASSRRKLTPLTPDEVQWIYTLLRSARSPEYHPGTRVRIKEGPFEGLEGTVEAVAGQMLSVRVPLNRTMSTACCSLDTVEAA